MECNTIWHGFDGGKCCDENVGCLPWRCQDRKDRSIYGSNCADSAPYCNTTQYKGINWLFPAQTNADACPVTCKSCGSSNENILSSWPYAWTFGNDDDQNITVVPTMPATFHKVLRQQQIAEHMAKEGSSRSIDNELIEHQQELYDELLLSLPSFTCPECRSYPDTEPYRSIPFTVDGKRSENMFKQLNKTKPRMRFLSRPNLVLYGLLVTQTREKKKVCSAKGDTLLAKFEYLGKLCHAEESKESFGVDPTFLESSSVFREVRKGQSNYISRS